MPPKNELPKLEAWKRQVRALMGAGLSHREAVRRAIAANIPAYIEALRECNFTNAQIIDNLMRHGM